MFIFFVYGLYGIQGFYGGALVLCSDCIVVK